MCCVSLILRVTLVSKTETFLDELLILVCIRVFSFSDADFRVYARTIFIVVS